MKFNKRDVQEYKDFLKAQIKVESRKEDSITKFYNIDSLYRDFNSLK